MAIPFSKVFVTMVKQGMLRFKDSREGSEFFKIAQGDPLMAQAAMPPEAMPPEAMMGQAAMPQAAMPPEAMMGQAAMPADIMSQAAPSGSTTAIGEAITNKDIESLIKVINLLMSMKSEYDSMKKDQMAMIEQQMSNSVPAMPPPGV